MATIAPFVIEYANRFARPADAAIDARLTITPDLTRRHRADDGANAVIGALHVHVEQPLEVGRRRLLDRADVRDARTVDEDVDGAAFENLGHRALDVVRDRDIDAPARGAGGWTRFQIEDVHHRAAGRELLDDGQADAAGSAGHDGDLAGKPRRGRAHDARHADPCG